MNSLQFISHHNEHYSYLDSIRLALDGGCRWIQLRIKDATNEQVLPIAIEAQRMCRQANATFIIDDRVELVKELKADGVHLGLKDMPISQARQILGDGFIIGGTANTFENVKAHYESGANYVGCGPFRFTTTKKNLSPILGLTGYRDIITRMRKQGIDIPLIAIGGIEPDDITPILETGVTGIAISGTVLRDTNPIEKMKQIIKIIQNG